MAAAMEFTVDGRPVEIPDDGASLMEVLRDRLGISSVKDGCSPQGQCGCCTVWVDGQPECRVSPRPAGWPVVSSHSGRAELGDPGCLEWGILCCWCQPMRVLHSRHHNAPFRSRNSRRRRAV